MNKEFWLFTLRWVKNGETYITNIFCDAFPTRKGLLQNVTDGEEYAILHIHELTKEQYNKLTKE